MDGRISSVIIRLSKINFFFEERGSHQQVYMRRLATRYAGRDFLDLAIEVFARIEIIVMGLVLQNPDEEEPRVVLQPGRDYIIKNGDRVILIAMDAKSADLLELEENALVIQTQTQNEKKITQLNAQMKLLEKRRESLQR
jgi:hypothetical protein